MRELLSLDQINALVENFRLDFRAKTKADARGRLILSLAELLGIDEVAAYQLLDPRPGFPDSATTQPATKAEMTKAVELTHRKFYRDTLIGNFMTVTGCDRDTATLQIDLLTGKPA